MKKRWDRRSVSSGDSVGEANEALGVLREGRVECLRHKVRQLQYPEQGEEGGGQGPGGTLLPDQWGERGTSISSRLILSVPLESNHS